MPYSLPLPISPLFLKSLALVLIVLGLQIPLASISDLLSQRAERRAEAGREIERMSGGHQSIAGPFLIGVVSVEASPDRPVVGNDKGEAFQEEIIYLPVAKASIDAEVRGQDRRRGLYAFKTYEAVARIRGEAKVAAEELGSLDGGRRWKRAYLAMRVTSPAFVQSVQDMKWNDRALEADEGPFSGIIAAEIPLDTVEAGKGASFSLTIALKGGGSLRMVPTARAWEATARISGVAPKFFGDLLPSPPETTLEGTVARWSSGAFGSRFRLHERAKSVDGLDHLKRPSIEIALDRGIDSHDMVSRITSYQLLFVLLTFSLYLVIELAAMATVSPFHSTLSEGISNARVERVYRPADAGQDNTAQYTASPKSHFSGTKPGGRSIHPIQYAFVGLALTLFYLLLLALAEHIGFDRAYLLASVVNVAMIVGYSSSFLRTRGQTIAVAGALGVLYAFFYFVLQEEDYALLYGATALTGALAALMYVTRRVDWYSLAGSPVFSSAPGPSPHSTEQSDGDD